MRVPGLKSWTVQDSADVEEALERVRTKRHVASTALNEAGPVSVVTTSWVQGLSELNMWGLV